MSKIYLFLLMICVSKFSYSQCPVIDGAMVNSCAPGATNEGYNEFVFFTTASSGAVSLYKLSYGSNATPASSSPTGIMSGVNAAAKIGTGTIVIQNGCNLIEVTTPSTVIPANSRVVFIPNNFDQQYDLSALCKDGNLYVAYIAATVLPSKWLANGTFANASSALRYIQLEYNGNACTANVRSYDGDLWSLPGNGPESEGNSLAWDANGNTLYLNNGCSIVIVTPVKLVSFLTTQKGKDVVISWKTTNEINTRSFEIEWSADGINFKSIGILNAAGNSTAINDYSFSDKGISTTGNNFYRLKTIDKDGKYSYSFIQKINLSGTGSINVYPLISSGKLSVEINLSKPAEVNAVIFDLSGRLLSSRKTMLLSGYNKFDLNINTLSAGEYILKLLNNNETNIVRFTKF
ncbi:MAG: T9SS type A sorting domain-containing protein [Bacteroidota bacterium]